MQIKPHKTIYLTILLLSLISTVVALLFAIEFESSIPAACVFILCFAIILQYAIAYGRSFCLCAEGIVIKFWFFKKFLSWKELKILRFSNENSLGYKSNVTDGVEITKHGHQRPQTMDPLVYCFFCPTKYIFFSFINSAKSGKEKRFPQNPIYYEIDSKSLLALFNSWGQCAEVRRRKRD